MNPGGAGRPRIDSISSMNKGVRNTVIILALTAIAFYVGFIVMMRSAGA